MITCPKCGELNGNDRSTCYKCGAAFGAAEYYKKICPKCGHIYSSRTDVCTSCGSRLGVYSGPPSHNSDSNSSNTWMYVLAVLIPIVGLILGFIQIGRGNNNIGKHLIILSIVLSIIYSLSWWFVVIML